MNRQDFLRLLTTAPFLTILGLATPVPAIAVDSETVVPTGWEILRQVDKAVDLAYDRCANNSWALPYQHDYLKATLKAARAYEAYEPDDPMGQNYYRLAVDIATDIRWDPRAARPEDVELIMRAAAYVQRYPNGSAHPERARALLERIRIFGNERR